MENSKVSITGQIIGQIDKGISIHLSLNNLCEHMAFVSQIEPKFVIEALNDENWVTTMHDELNQFIFCTLHLR